MPPNRYLFGRLDLTRKSPSKPVEYLKMNRTIEEEILGILESIARREKLEVAVESNLKAGAIAAGSALLGGLLAGKTGTLIGAVAGGLLGVSSTDSKSVIPIIREMTDKERMGLYGDLMCLTGVIAIAMLPQELRNSELTPEIAALLKRFLQSKGYSFKQ